MKKCTNCENKATKQLEHFNYPFDYCDGCYQNQMINKIILAAFFAVPLIAIGIGLISLAWN